MGLYGKWDFTLNLATLSVGTFFDEKCYIVD